MSYPGFTIKNATFTVYDATKYHFNNNIGNQIAFKNRYSVLMWYQCEGYHMFFSLASYPSDDMSPPKTHDEFMAAETMYFFETEHVAVSKLVLMEKGEKIICQGIPSDSTDEAWRLLEVDDCVGIYRLDGDVLHHVYDTYQEAFHSGLIEWEPRYLGILEKDEKKEV
ncbi:MAG: hypothetical protein PHV62_05865 [Sulfuricurvum sp.]|nr:hypothetical protein [Sulfuricurvum sp.]